MISDSHATFGKVTVTVKSCIRILNDQSNDFALGDSDNNSDDDSNNNLDDNSENDSDDD